MTVDSLLAEASASYVMGQQSEGQARESAYEAVLQNLDRIVEEFPGSDLAVQILLGEAVGGIDLAKVQRTLPEMEATSAALGGVRPEAEPILSFAPAFDTPESTPSEISGVTADIGPPAAAPDAPPGSEPLASPALSPPLPARSTVANAETIEEALGLDRAARREIQRRLVLLDLDTRGVDGIFGPGTRGAISNWQRIRGHAVTGFLDRGQLQDLQAQTEVAFEQWLREQADAQSRPTATTSEDARQGSRTGRYLDSRGCIREADGHYVPNFKPTCR
ncbi:MAG: peptidoglycan-binding protein [Thioalkalivibrio sp.]|nr:peptidoglycan-binding protein [Thioalkalivibrio sp.]